jgi:predicted ATPase
MATGHGGQVLVSLVAARLAGDRPDLVDLGEHRLRDLGTPERIHQVGTGDFPPLRTLDRAPNNLPVLPTSFVGRHREFDQLRDLVQGSRVVTVTGVGGAGKTRLALQVAAEVGTGFPDGVWLVELAPVTDPELVDAAFAEALGVRQDGDKSIHQAVLDHLAPLSALLVVDNCEHVISDAADVVDDILAASPDTKVIATSRELLGIGGEVAFGLRSMSLPRRGEAIDAEALAGHDAVQLFTERATAAKPDFRVDDANAEAVLEICRRLDGMPLALELAAARIRAFPPAKLAQLLDQRFRLLTGGSRTALPRQQTLAATIEWSYRLLDEKEQALLRRLSAFQGGFTYEAVTAVAATDPIDEFDVVELIPSLVDKSLVVADDVDGEPRYRLLETIRQFARDLFEDSPEADDVRLAHAEFFEALAREAGRNIRGPDELQWWETVDRELDNLRLATTWALEHDRVALALSIATGFWRFWWFKGRWSEGVEWIEPALGSGADLPPLLTAEAHLALGSLDLTARVGSGGAIEHLEAAVTAFREAYDRGDPALEPSNLTAAYINLGAQISGSSNDPANLERSIELNHEALRLAEATGLELSITVAAGNIAASLADRGEIADARAWLDRALAVAEKLGSNQRLADLHNQVALIEFQAGNLDGAVAAMARSVDHHAAGQQIVQARRQRTRLEVFRLQADPNLAGTDLRAAIRDAAHLPEVMATSALLAELMADVVFASGRDGAHEHVPVAWAVYDELVGAEQLDGAPEFFREATRSTIEAAKAALGEPRFVELDARGRSMTRAEMISFLLE